MTQLGGFCSQINLRISTRISIATNQSKRHKNAAAAASPVDPEQDPKPAVNQNPPSGSEKYPSSSLTDSRRLIQISKSGDQSRPTGKQEAPPPPPLCCFSCGAEPLVGKRRVALNWTHLISFANEAFFFFLTGFFPLCPFQEA